MVKGIITFISYYLKKVDLFISGHEPHWKILLVFYLIIVFGLFRLSVFVSWENRTELNTVWHASMINQAAASPLQYRVLSFLLPEMIIRLLGISPFGAYMLFRFLYYSVGIVLFHLYLRKWFKTKDAVFGTLLLVCSYAFTIMPVLQPSSPLNFIIFLLGFWAIREKKDWFLGIIILLGTFNRFSPVFLVASYFLVNYKFVSQKTLIFKTLRHLFLWFAVFVGLRLFFGLREGYAPLFVLPYNIMFAMTYLFRPTIKLFLNTSLLSVFIFGIFWYFAFRDMRQKPVFLVRLLGIVPLYVLIHLLFSLLIEARLLLPLAPVIIPSGLMSLLPRLQKVT